MAEKSKQLNHQEQLMLNFNFTSEELEANRQGYMTPGQIEKFRNLTQYRWKRLAFIAAVLFIFPIITFSPLDFVPLGRAHDAMIQMALGSFLLGVFLSLVAVNNYRKQRKTFEGDKVMKVQGMAIIETDREGSPSLRINATRFFLNYKKLNSVQNNRLYIVYYILPLFDILAIEEFEEEL